MTADAQKCKTSYTRGQIVTVTLPVSDSGRRRTIKGAPVKAANNRPQTIEIMDWLKHHQLKRYITLNYKLSNSSTKGTYSSLWIAALVICCIKKGSPHLNNQ